MTAANFARLDGDRPEVSRLMTAMLQAREALAAGHGLIRKNMLPRNGGPTCSRTPCPATNARQPQPWCSKYLPARDEPREIILVACTKCDWKAAFRRADLALLWQISGVTGDFGFPNQVCSDS